MLFYFMLYNYLACDVNCSKKGCIDIYGLCYECTPGFLFEKGICKQCKEDYKMIDN